MGLPGKTFSLEDGVGFVLSLLACLSLGNLVGLARSRERCLRVRPPLLAAPSYSEGAMSWVRCPRCGAQAGEGGARGRGPGAALPQLSSWSRLSWELQAHS